MKNLLLALVVAVAVVAGFSVDAQAADPAISSSMLADMGLADMQVLSDAEGMQVRGMAINFAALLNNVNIGQAGTADNSGVQIGVVNVGAQANNSNVFGRFATLSLF